MFLTMYLKTAVQMAVFCLGLLIAFNEALRLPIADQSRDYNHAEISRREKLIEIGLMRMRCIWYWPSLVKHYIK